MLKIRDKTDRALFFTSTIVSLGNGRNTPFWEARWIKRVAPKDLASNLFIQARYKVRTIEVELQHFNWLKNLKQVNTEDLMDEFIMPFSILREVQLNDYNDNIQW
jgi:hypothetical protein